MQDAECRRLGCDRDRSNRSVDRDGEATRPVGDYRLGEAGELEFEAASFDLVVSYLTLIDIADFRAAIDEMARVLKPGGSLLKKRPSTHSCATDPP